MSTSLGSAEKVRWSGDGEFRREIGESDLRHCGREVNDMKSGSGLLKFNWLVTAVAVTLAAVAAQSPLF